MTDVERRAALEQIADEIRGCTQCRLHRDRTNSVPGEGSASTEVVFVGEGPGLNEDRQGRPFVGQAGSLLTELIGSIGWRREDVFITNIVKCRPPGNRDPEPDEIAACAPYLQRQLAVLEPALVVTLGRHSMGRFMPGARIGQAHGSVRPSDPGAGPPGAHVFAMYHPAAALHQQSLRQTLFDDMRGIPAALLAARAEREQGTSAALAAAQPLAPSTAAAGAEEAEEGPGTAPEAAGLAPEAAGVPSGARQPGSPEARVSSTGRDALEKTAEALPATSLAAPLDLAAPIDPGFADDPAEPDASAATGESETDQLSLF